MRCLDYGNRIGILNLFPLNKWIVSIGQSYFVIGTVCALFVVITGICIYYSYRYRRYKRLAFIDPLTGGMNRVAFQHACQRLIKTAPPNTYVVVLVNIKNFKMINEYYGIGQGDNILRHVMAKLRDSLREGELAAHMESDHFLLLLHEQVSAVSARTKQIISDINSSLKKVDFPTDLTMTLGICAVENPKMDIRIILERVRMASQIRFSNTDSDSCVFYDAHFAQQLQREYSLNQMFFNSIKNHDFEVYFQPKICLKTNTVCGAEALVRWNHLGLGLLYPVSFIHQFEKNGYIEKLDLYVLEEVCRTLNRWSHTGITPVPISVNLSRYHFLVPDCLQKLKQIADSYEVPCNLLELELTESMFFGESELPLVKQQIEQMHRLFFRCSLDDFGVGYSSLDLLLSFDVDTIKLDRKFVRDPENQRAVEIVTSVVQLAKGLNIQLVAEGIETEQQLSFIRQVGCDVAQGFFFSRPLPIPAFEKQWMQ